MSGKKLTSCDRLICVIGIAPVSPAEFVIFRIARSQQGMVVTE